MTTITSRHEEPVYIRFGEEDLFGVFVTPPGEALGVAVVILAGGNVPSVGRNRVMQRLAREAADQGFHALRIDYHGVGESSGFVETFRLNDPFGEVVKSCVTWLAERGLDQIVLVGSCFGARTALAGLADIEDLRGVALLSMPFGGGEIGVRGREQPLKQFVAHYRRRATIKDVVKGLRRHDTRHRYWFLLKTVASGIAARTRQRFSSEGQDPYAWIGRGITRALRWLADKEVPVLFVYGDEDEEHDDYKRLQGSDLAKLMAQAPNFEMVLHPGVLHGYLTIQSQEQTLATVREWLGKLATSKEDLRQVGS